jgi:hypothetical protein
MENVQDLEKAVLSKWTEIKAVVEALEADVVKSSRGVAAAGVRARKGLRTLKNLSSELVKMTYPDGRGLSSSVSVEDLVD